ncbi:SGNH/GDSL hydrolase family protein [Spirosoma sp. SC4-14]|uniref:SGNH/GDSL hydrolase family protein n=1 Tax=Spirosoma sp. SC4-14 TaxID=3128900 RepID=UPI0030CE805B
MLTTPKTPVNCITPDCLPQTYTRHFPPTIPPAIPQGLPVPTFTQDSGSINYGGKVPLSATGMPTGAVFEYSYDNGKSWTVGSQVPIISKNTVLARTRINDLVSEPASANYSLYFQRMLVIGNSIMSHAPYPEVGWYNNNGMAASAPEKDFVHLLNGYLQTLYPAVNYQLQTGGNFERQFGAPGYSIDEFNTVLQQYKPDLIIVRIGENVDEGDVFSRNFELQFRNLLDKLATYSGQPVKIVCSTSVWNRPQTDISIRKVTLEKGFALADLREIVPQSKYFASQYANPSVAAHPNDLGMQRIADLIWQQIP